MTKLEVGSYIGIPCSVQDGPFDTELLVEFETLDGTVSGFTSVENIREKEEQHFIKGKIVSVGAGVVTAWVEGSFFTTNGLANFSPERVGTQFMALAA